MPEDESLLLNTSKYYLKNNLVIENPSQIHENQDVNEYLLNVIKSGHKEQYKPHQSESPTKPTASQSALTSTFRKNMKNIMHYRNIYVFLANVSDQISAPDPNYGIFLNEDDNLLVALVLTKKILSMTEWLMTVVTSD